VGRSVSSDLVTVPSTLSRTPGLDCRALCIVRGLAESEILSIDAARQVNPSPRNVINAGERTMRIAVLKS